jgi:hypothetical protein
MRKYWLPGAILLMTLAVYLPTLRYGLVYDDLGQLVKNPRLTAWHYVPGYFTTHVWAHLAGQPANYYRPVFLLWLRLMYVLCGAPGPLWHLPTVLTHLGATVAVFALLKHITEDLRASAVATAVFAVHPIHTEAVAWVSAVSEPLFTALLIGCVYFYSRRRGRVSLLSLALALAAMLTKEVGIIAPLLIAGYACTRSTWKQALSDAAPYLLPVVVVEALRWNAMGTLGTTMPVMMSQWQMALTWPSVLALDARHILWPVHLSESYPVEIGTSVLPLILLAVLMAVAMVAFWKASANVRFAILWIVFTLAPTLALRSLFYGDFVHDRYLYLPSVGLALLLAIALRHIQWRPAYNIGVLLVLAALIVGTERELPVWRSNLSLFTRAVETSPSNPYLLNSLGQAYMEEHQVAEAQPLLERAIAINPIYWKPYYNLALCYQEQGQPVEARAMYERAMQVRQQTQ